MTRGKWWIGAALLLGIGFAGLWFAAMRIRDRFEPYIRSQAVAYLQKRFHADVEISSLKIHIPTLSPVQVLFKHGLGTIARVDGTGVILRQQSTPNYPPFLKLSHFSFDVDLGRVFDPAKTVSKVTLSGMEITIPPKGEQRTPITSNGKGSVGQIMIPEIVASDSRLIILPKQKDRKPLTFEISGLRLTSVGKDIPLKYEATLTNPKPVGLVHSAGNFGPWNADEPGDTPLNGTYTFDHADLSIFSAIAGILNSKGDFTGTLSAINAHGVATVPDFRLKTAGNPVSLSTEFDVLVDGGNGNTILKPVHAILGSTRFTTSGAVIKQDGDPRRSIALDVSMPAGNLRDVLTLAMKDTPFMEGVLTLQSKIAIPPLTGKVKDKLILDGKFKVSKGRFLRSEIQSKIDGLSRRGQGQPKNEEITEVFSDMTGKFHLQDHAISFQSLTFGTDGAAVQLAGSYDLGKDELDFHGSLSLQAKVSQTMTGWKRWALKPVDPFFAKNGAGTFLRIKIDGSSKSPNFGLDHDPPPPPATSSSR